MNNPNDTLFSFSNEQRIPQISSIRDWVNTQRHEITSMSDLADFVINNDWCPAIFEGNYRNEHNFISSDFIALDVDNGCTLDDAITYFRSLDIQFIIGTTKSHGIDKVTKNGAIKPACHRFRIVFPLEKRITSTSDFGATWTSLFNSFPHADISAKDPSRLFKKCIEIAYIHFSEKNLKPTTADTISTPQPQVQARPILPKLGRPSQRTLEFINEGVANNFNTRLYLASRDLQEQGYCKEQAITAFQQMNHDNYYGHLDETDLRTIESAFSKPPRYAPRVQFPVTEQRGDKICPTKLSPENLSFLIKDILGIKIEFNEMKRRVFCNDTPMENSMLAEIRTAARIHKLSDSKDFALDTINVIAAKNKAHPFKSFVESTPWDNQNHINELFETITISPEFTEYKENFRLAFKRFFIGMIAKVYRPGSQNLTLVFKGEQGTNKSRWIERLAVVEGMYAESGIDPDSKDDRARHLSYILHHISELDGTTNRKDIAALKSFLTLEDISVRLPYDPFPSDGKSTLSFIASVNSEDFLRDPTGSRRFLVIPTEVLNADHSVNLQQVYAQALALFQAKERYWFEASEVTAINIFNEAFQPSTAAKDIISGLEQGNDDDWLSFSEIVTLSLRQLHTVNETEFRRLMKQAGFKKEIQKRNGIKTTKYNVKLNHTKK